MIPKIIHYCWFGNGEMPEKNKRCIASWKKFCPDYKIIRWDESNYDVKKNDYMKEAYETKSWGFVPDYARLDIIYQFGGIYLDTDVELIKNIDELLSYDAFMGFEDGVHVSPGLCIAAKPHHETIKRIMDEIYLGRKFIKRDGSPDLTPSPIMNTNALLTLGLRQDDSLQSVGNVMILPTEFFCPKDYKSGKLNITSKTYGIHWFNASWQSPHRRRMLKVRRIIGEERYFGLVRLKNKILRKGR